MTNIIKKSLEKSIIITGASVTGKTTLCRRLIVHFGLDPMPVHTTRKLRDGEIENIDSVTVSEEEFKSRFYRGEYLQESLESAYFNGAYYGCPREWIDSTNKGVSGCFVCPTVKMAKEIKEMLREKIFWIHLVANTEIRQQRLMRRDPKLKKEDFNERIERGDAPVDIGGCDLIIDTSYLNAWEIFFHALARI